MDFKWFITYSIGCVIAGLIGLLLGWILLKIEDKRKKRWINESDKWICSRATLYWHYNSHSNVYTEVRQNIIDMLIEALKIDLEEGD